MLATILIAEGHELLRSALHGWLETRFPNYHLVEAASITEAIPMAQARSREVIIMDFGLVEMGCLEAIERIKTVAPAAQIVVLTDHEEEEFQGTLALANEPGIYFLWKDNMLIKLEPLLAPLLLRVKNGATRPRLEQVLI
jgi:DNA-binding NarL/FixJ family response regulator